MSSKKNRYRQNVISRNSKIARIKYTQSKLATELTPVVNSPYRFTSREDPFWFEKMLGYFF